MLGRGGREMEMDDFKVFVNNLVERNILVNKGDDERGESFCLGSFLETNVNIDADNSIFTQTNAAESTSVENFINESFYTTLISKIKDEVKIAVCNELKVVNSDRYTNKRAKECNCNTEIIETLNKHVDFLQKELLSKDAIINMLITDKCTTNVDSNNNEYKYKTELQNKQTLRKHDINPSTHRNNSDTHKNNSDTHNNNSDTHNNNSGTHKIIPAHIIIIPAHKNMILTNTNNCNGTDFEDVNSKKKSGNQRSISIIGDSILKEIDPYLMRKKLNNKTDKLYVHSFKGATVKHMNHHAQPVMGYNPNLVIIHAVTNSLRGSSTPDEVATEILELTTSLKNGTNEIVVSSIVPRRDHLNEKVGKVNDALTTKTSALGIGFISRLKVYI